MGGLQKHVFIFLLNYSILKEEGRQLMRGYISNDQIFES